MSLRPLPPFLLLTLLPASCASVLAEAPASPAALARFTPAICQIVGDDGSSGSGFILHDPDDESGLLIVTALHVVAEGEHFSIKLATTGGETMTVSEVEVVKTSPDDDLALLRSPLVGRGVAGLELTEELPALGEPLFAYGYPYVDASTFELTLEQGSLTAQHRSVAGRDYIQTNANINPGNSGGPALDRHGRVVGVVSARAAHQQGIGLLVPATRVAELRRAYRTPRQEPSLAARARLSAFLAALEYGQSGDAAGFLSQRFLRVEVFQAFQGSMKSTEAKLTLVREYARRSRGIDFDRLPEEVQAKVLDEVLKPEEKASVLAAREYQGSHNLYAAMQTYFGHLAAHLFVGVDQWQLVSMQPATDARRFTALVMGRQKETLAHYRFSLVYLRGEWSIDDVTVL